MKITAEHFLLSNVITESNLKIKVATTNIQSLVSEVGVQRTCQRWHPAM